MRGHLAAAVALLAPAAVLSACAPAIPAGFPSPDPELPGVAVTPSWRQSAHVTPPATTAGGAAPGPTAPPEAPAGLPGASRAPTASSSPSIPPSLRPTPPAATSTPPPFDGSGSARLVALPTSAHATSRLVIAHLTVRGRGTREGYARGRFGIAWSDDVAGVTWGHNGCGTRDDILARDLDATTRRSGCVVTGGRFVDPYTAGPQHFVKAKAARWPIDHLVPLSYAWQMGANTWTDARRASFANDPLNLVVTVESANSAKSDSSPASWLPPDKAIRCAYATRFAEVALKYSLPVTVADRQLMVRQCPA